MKARRGAGAVRRAARSPSTGSRSSSSVSSRRRLTNGRSSTASSTSSRSSLPRPASCSPRWTARYRRRLPLVRPARGSIGPQSRQWSKPDSRRSWSESGDACLIALGGERGDGDIIEVGGFRYPEHRERYLDLALPLARVCTLALGNARAFRRLETAREALRATTEPS